MHKKISAKLLIAGCAVALISVIAAELYASVKKSTIHDELLSKTVKAMVSEYEKQIESKKLIGETAAIAISSSSKIATAMHEKDVAVIESELGNLSKTYKENTELKNIQMRFIDATGRLIYSSTDGAKNMGKQVTHEPMYAKEIADKKPFALLGPSSSGVTINALSPVFLNGEYVGFINFIQGVRSVAAELEKDHVHFVQIVEKSLFEQSPEASFHKVANNPAVNAKYIITNPKYFNDTIVKQIQERFAEMGNDGSQEMLSKGYRFGKNLVYATTPIIDGDKTIGYNIAYKTSTEMDALLAEAYAPINMVLYTSIVLTIILTGIFIGLFEWLVARNLRKVSDSIAHASKTGDLSLMVPNTENGDEISQMVTVINNDRKMLHTALADLTRAAQQIAVGDFSARSDVSTHGDLGMFMMIFDGMREEMIHAFDAIKELAFLLDNSEFQKIRESSVIHLKGEYLNVVNRVVSAGNTLSENFAEIQHVMSEVANGNLTYRVTAEAKGELNALKDNINQTVSAMHHLFDAFSDAASSMSKGDLTHKVDVAALAGEYRIMAESMNAATDQMAHLIGEVQSMSAQVSGLSSQLATEANHMSDRMQQQAAAVEETAAAMEESAQSINASQANVNQVTSLAHEQHQSLSRSQVDMDNTVAAMRRIQEQAKAINGMVTLIDSIAFQTNLLALNAAVEAARAGEHGRGFAVVASEVRSLAQKSAEAAKDIKGTIEGTIVAIDDGVVQIDKVTQGMATVSSAVSRMTELVSEVNRAAEEQAVGIVEVNKSMSHIDSGIQQNAAGTEEIQAVCHQLNEMTDQLSQTMSKFTIDAHKVVSMQQASTSKQPTVKKTASLPSPARKQVNAAVGDWSDF